MTALQLATLVLRLLGLYCVIQGIQLWIMFAGLATVANLSIEAGGRPVLIPLVGWVPGACQAGLGLLLLVFAGRLASLLTSSMAGGAGIVPFPLEQVQTLAFAVAGILIFADALPQFLNAGGQLTTALSRPDNGLVPALWPGWSEVVYSAAGTVLQAVLGLALFFGARGFANFWRTLRTAGTPKPPSPACL